MIDQEKNFQTHHKKLYNFCLKLTRDRFQADDLFQETWAKAIEKSDQFKENASYDRWLMGICINLYRDFYRRNRLTGKLFQIFVQTEAMEATITSVRDPKDTTEEIMIQAEQRVLLKKALDLLNDKYRLPLILFYYNDYSYCQIAEILDIKEGTVKSRIFSAKAKLKERMVSYEG